jgi:hypothetical protein
MLLNPKDASNPPGKAADSPRWAAARRVTREWSPDARISLRTVFRAIRHPAKKADRT